MIQVSPPTPELHGRRRSAPALHRVGGQVRGEPSLLGLGEAPWSTIQTTGSIIWLIVGAASLVDI